ncbi:hypothetical protein ACFVHB_04305 [Kitasatospora sp. NPDC127111]|uniref:hypothetical protein n=1 Tax=Kitasatospora sp. NPDC127111 TaxID=3345363 RepID=UPI00362644DA
MSPANATQIFVVSTAQDVLAAGHELRNALDNPAHRAAAADRLALVAEAALGGLDDLAVRNFEAVEGGAGGETPEERETAADEVLTGTVGDLNVAQVTFAAGAALGEGGEAEPAPDTSGASPGGVAGTGPAPDTAAPLDQALRLVRESAEAVATGMNSGPTAAAWSTPPTPPAASGGSAVSASALRQQASATLDGLVAQVSDVATGAASLARKAVPVFDAAWEQIGKVVRVGQIVGRFVRLGLRAVEAALNRLYTLVHADFLRTARDKVHAIWENARDDATTPAMIRVVIGADAAEQGVGRALTGDGFHPDRLDLAAGRVRELGSQFGRLMGVAQAVVGALAAVGVVSAIFHLVLPQVAIAIGAIALAVVAASVVLGSDYADSGTGRGLVRGVHGTVLDAVR